MKSKYLLIIVSLCVYCFFEISCSSTNSKKNQDNLSAEASRKAKHKITEEKKDENSTSPEDSITQMKKDLDDEVTIGREMASKLYGTYGELRQIKEIKYLNLVLQSIVRKIGRPEINYKIGILDTDELNAFATPGGYILITKGLILSLKNEEELAGVISHEIAHINFKHLYKEVNKNSKNKIGASETITRIILQGRSDFTMSLIKAVEDGVKTLTDKGLKPELEFEADENAINYTWATGYSSKSYLNVLERLKQQTSHDAILLKTHPSFEQRIQKINTYITTAHIDPITNDSEIQNRSKRFDEMKKLL